MAFIQNDEHLMVAMLLFQIYVHCRIKSSIYFKACRVQPLRTREQTKKETDSGGISPTA